SGNNLFFVANDSNGSALWKSDGTTAGTGLVASIPGLGEPGVGANTAHLTPLPKGGVVFLRASELWVSDGTSAGTRSIRQFTAGAQPLAKSTRSPGLADSPTSPAPTRLPAPPGSGRVTAP